MNYWKWFWLNVRRAPVCLLLHPGYVPLLVKRFQFLFTRRYCGRSLPRIGVWNEMTMINAWVIHVLREIDGPWVDEFREAMAPVVLDIGSNTGQFSNYVKELNPGCRIYSWDAWEEATHYVRFSTRHEACGLGNRYGSATLFVNKTTASTKGVFAGYEPSEKQVPIKPLDSFDLPDEILLMKVDVDGAELEVLEGAKETLSRVKYLLVETLALDSVKRLAPDRRWTTNNCGCDWTGELICERKGNESNSYYQTVSE